MQTAQPAPAVFAMMQAVNEAGDARSPTPAITPPELNTTSEADVRSDDAKDAAVADVVFEEQKETPSAEPRPGAEIKEETATHSPLENSSATDAPNTQRALSLKLRLGNSPQGDSGGKDLTHPPSVAPEAMPYANGSRRRSERIRNVSARSEELRRAREERAAAEKARTEARSAAARKGVKTKRKAAVAAAAGLEPPAKRVPRQIVTLKYANRSVPPTFTPVAVEGNEERELFWLRVNLREFLLRFDKLCRVPARYTVVLNDPLATWPPDLFKAVVLAMLKLIQNDAAPLHAGVRTYAAEIDRLEATDPKMWEWVLEFVEQLDAFAPTVPPANDLERLDLVRRLMVVCTGTETIRITVMSDVDQLKLVEKDASDEVKQVYVKLKETEQKLAKLKQVDKQVYREKVAAAQRAADAKAWRAQQQLYQKTHKFNMRTTPMATDALGNRYWSLQYKSKEHASWGAWIVCEFIYDPLALAAWYQRFGTRVAHVLQGRDEMVAEKNAERKRLRKEARERQAAPSTDQPEGAAGNGDGDADAESEQRAHTKRRYPKLKIDFPKPLSEPSMYYVEGRDNIVQLAEWVGGLRGVEPKMKSDLEEMAHFLGQEE